MNTKTKVVALVGSASTLVAGSAFAVDVAASINTAFTSAQTNVGAVVVGVIALAAVATGVGLIIRFLSR